MAAKWTDEATASGVGDNVVCCNCDAHSAIKCGGESCPQCGASGCLRWFDDNAPEVTIGNDSCISVCITGPGGEYREFDFPLNADGADDLVVSEIRQFRRYCETSNT